MTKKKTSTQRLQEDYKRKEKEREEAEWVRMQTTGGGAETWLKINFFLYFYCQLFKAMTLTSKFKKDISTLRAAVNQEIFLDVKHPKLYKKVRRYYENAGLQLNGEDPDIDYNSVIDCIAEDLILNNQRS